MSANPTHTVLKSSGYYYKRRVPADLVKKLGKSFWEHSLGTKDRKLADRLARKHSIVTDELIDGLRRPSPLEILQNNPELFSNEERDKIVQIGGPQALAKFIESDLGVLNLMTAGYELRYETPAEADWPDESSRSFRERSRDEMERERSLLVIDWIKQRISELHSIQAKLGTPNEAAKAVADTVSPSLSAILERWKVETVPSDTSYESFRNTVRRFEELHGPVPVSNIERRHVREFADAIANFPASSRADVRSADIKGALAIATKEKLAPIQRKTRDKHLSTIKALIRFAADQGFLNDDPLKSYNPTKAGKKLDKQHKGSSRRPFTVQELHQLIHANCSIRSMEEDDFWIPLVALFSGMRVEEICQLTLTDVRLQSDILLFDVNDHDEKRLKNTSSRRLVPVHAQLLDIGFKDFISKSPGPRVFQSLKADSRGKFSGAYEKRFSRILRKSAGIGDRQVTFHSLRHSFADACRNLDGTQTTPQPILERLMGHAPSNAISAGYGHGYDLEKLNKWLQKIDPLGARLTSVLGSK